MRKMRQKANGGLPQLGQKTPSAPGETLSEMNIAPMAFSLNQSSAVCLPLVSDSQRLIWVHSNEINLQLDCEEKLDKAFDRFPYLTQKQTATLAQRCSLHPDQVKVWFMVQRLRYGISWDYKDITIVRRKVKSSRGKKELQNRKGEEVKGNRGENKKCKRGLKEPGGEKEEVREEQSESEGRMMGENVRPHERLESKMKQEQPMKKESDRKVEEDKRSAQKKWKMMTVTDRKGKKRMKQGEEGVVERAEEVEKSTQSETALFTTKKKKANKEILQEQPGHKSFVVPDELLDARPQLTPLSQTKAFDVPLLTDDNTELLRRVNPVKSGFKGKTETQTHAESTGVADSDDAVDARTLPTRIRCTTKTQTQLAMMKAAFSHCQYPDGEDYGRLAMMIGIPRYMLVQWFGDMRYYIKKIKPGWMTHEQHSRALDNVRYRQCLKALLKTQARVSEGDGKAAWKIKLDRSESCGEEGSVE